MIITPSRQIPNDWHHPRYARCAHVCSSTYARDCSTRCVPADVGVLRLRYLWLCLCSCLCLSTAGKNDRNDQTHDHHDQPVAPSRLTPPEVRVSRARLRLYARLRVHMSVLSIVVCEPHTRMFTCDVCVYHHATPNRMVIRTPSTHVCGVCLSPPCCMLALRAHRESGLHGRCHAACVYTHARGECARVSLESAATVGPGLRPPYVAGCVRGRAPHAAAAVRGCPQVHRPGNGCTSCMCHTV